MLCLTLQECNVKWSSWNIGSIFKINSNNSTEIRVIICQKELE